MNGANEQKKHNKPVFKNWVFSVASSIWTRTKVAASFLKIILFPKGSISAGEDIRKAFSHINPVRACLVLVFGLLCVYTLTGIYIVNPGEQAIVRTLGQISTTPVSEGIHYRAPWPIGQVQKVNVSEVRRAEVGVNLPEHEHDDDAPSEMQLITGDENIINMEAIIHYKVKDAAAFLYRVNYDDERLVRDSVEAAMVKITAGLAVDDVLGGGKVPAQMSVIKAAQRILDAYGSGVQITALNIQAITPPNAVAEAFRSVTTAKADKEKEINLAKGYSNSLIPETRSRANAAVSTAEAYRVERVNRAIGDARKFETMLAEYQKDVSIFSQETTKFRLLLEVLDKTLPRAKKYVVDDTSGNTVNVKLYDRDLDIGRE
jgi:HflK protein